jgi:hypothetical protein
MVPRVPTLADHGISEDQSPLDAEPRADGRDLRDMGTISFASTRRFGCNRTAEVRGSNPLSSTTKSPRTTLGSPLDVDARDYAVDELEPPVRARVHIRESSPSQIDSLKAQISDDSRRERIWRAR